MAAEGKLVKMRIVGCRQIYSGVNGKGDQYTIWEVNATKENGEPIREKLRSFTALRVGTTQELRVVPFNSDRHGRSFTLFQDSPRTKPPAEGLAEEVQQLKQAVEALTGRVAQLEAGQPATTAAAEPTTGW